MFNLFLSSSNICNADFLRYFELLIRPYSVVCLVLSALLLLSWCSAASVPGTTPQITLALTKVKTKTISTTEQVRQNKPRREKPDIHSLMADNG